MPRYRIEYIRNKCIGAFACVSMDPASFAMNDDNKADLTNARKEQRGEDEVWIIETDELGSLVQAAQACPVNIIKVVDTKTGKVLAP
ncbi:MAG: ferredoxin [Candidatus Aenigmarchaeota archaeon]|nr:ferredoxin [Candidatus Aenigmarchaeota archaeon]